ncbi:MAG: glycosyltransferase [Bacteroidia bacterium]
MAENLDHIVFITPGFANDETDTACLPYLQVYFKALIDHGFKISIITLHYPYKNEIYKWNNCNVYSFKKFKQWQKPKLWLKAINTIINLNKIEPISVIHSFWLGECALLGHLSGKLIKVKRLNTLMGQDVLKGNIYCQILPIKKMSLISLSPNHQNTFLKNYKLEIPIIPWGIETKKVEYDLDKTIDFIGVGSLIPVKNYALFIDIIYKINKIRKVSAVIIGDGSEYELLKQKIVDLKLENVISLLGVLKNEEVLVYLSKSRILLHTSKFESFGMVFAEALQHRVMIVSSPVGALFESPNIALANNNPEFIKACENMLTKNFNPEFFNPFNIEKTIEGYNKYYK